MVFLVHVLAHAPQIVVPFVHLEVDVVGFPVGLRLVRKFQVGKPVAFLQINKQLAEHIEIVLAAGPMRIELVDRLQNV